MEGLAYLYCIEHILKKIYKDDEEGLKAAMLRESAAFNMTIAPAPFVMGISIAMEESVKRDPNQCDQSQFDGSIKWYWRYILLGYL